MSSSHENDKLNLFISLRNKLRRGAFAAIAVLNAIGKGSDVREIRSPVNSADGNFIRRALGLCRHPFSKGSEVSVKSAVRFILLVGILFGASSIFAATHPVPLDKNTPSEKCIECHTDKAKGKFVHSAIAMGCTSCHEIRVNKDVTRVKLITSTPQALCITCHTDKNAADLKGTVHPPAVRDCLKCHDPHQSDNKFQLLKPESGDKAQNLCLSCHTQGLDVPAGGSRHAALDMGCDTCHVTHKVGERGKAEFDFHLTKAPPALCVDCHDVKDESLIKAHQGQPFAGANCVQCHDPHQSTQAQADATVYASAVCHGHLRCVPSAGQGRQSRADAGRFQSAVRDLPRASRPNRLILPRFRIRARKAIAPPATIRTPARRRDSSSRIRCRRAWLATPNRPKA